MPHRLLTSRMGCEAMHCTMDCSARATWLSENNGTQDAPKTRIGSGCIANRPLGFVCAKRARIANDIVFGGLRNMHFRSHVYLAAASSQSVVQSGWQ